MSKPSESLLHILCWEWNLMIKVKEPFPAYKIVPSKPLDSVELFHLADVYRAKYSKFEGPCLSHIEQDYDHEWIMLEHLRKPRNMEWSPGGIKSSDDRRSFHDSAAQFHVTLPPIYFIPDYCRFFPQDIQSTFWVLHGANNERMVVSEVKIIQNFITKKETKGQSIGCSSRDIFHVAIKQI